MTPFIEKLRAANWQPSTNTKTKLDLTKAYQDFHKPSIATAKVSIIFERTKCLFEKLAFFMYIF